MELEILRNIKAGPYVEFNTTGKHWDDSALFLNEIVYGILSPGFEASSKSFNY